ncbi:Kef-type potassium/proton antiporter, CPA2 family [Roseivivax lentus]|uniref:Kef-type potassium/proton antiporter, CPA2 family n=1 Tax=Roseivivax lentus TaxID=633194 RepID=A0A1N7NND2_9RHOB|nr:monovalent cation:proton antiporter-2 (CPA2) family protein [Roseivivax lentus]SIS99933.1 Kef-type potassium/proton antiporter, CPA2 family [Roseivivax lentus]
MDTFLFQASIYLAAAVIAVPIAARLGLGSVLGYLAAGLVIGPVLGLVTATEDLQHFAEFGVVMMLFLIGLELEPRALWDMRHKLLGLGGLQVGVTTLAVTGLMMSIGYDWQTALAIGLIFALSSTAIVLQTLSEKRLIQTGGGRSTFSVLLTQDIAVIPMLVVIPLLAVAAPARLNPDGSIGLDHGEDAHHSMSLVEGLPGWGVTLVTLGAIAAIILAGVYLIGPLFRFIHQARLREMYTAVSLLIVLGIAFLMMLVGLSPALGTFLAGVVLANSEFRHELEADIEPFKGLLLGLFFITVGAGISFATFFAAPFLLLGLTLGMMALKGVILYGLGVLFGLKGKDRWLFTLGLAQAGEFGFVLVSFSLQQNVLADALGERILLVIALSMLFTPLAFIIYEFLSSRMTGEDQTLAEDEIDTTAPVIIAGIGRFGQIVNRMLQSTGFETVVVDHDMQTIQTMRRFGFKGFFGDPTRPDLLHAAGIDKARVLCVAVDDPEAAKTIVAYARRLRGDELHIVARARDRTHVYELYQAGADDIVRELFDASLRAGRYVLENMGLTEFEAAEAEKTFFQHDRMTVRELAQHWRPGVPAHENDAYIARAKELEKDLETALLSALDNRRDQDTGTG